MTPTDALRLLFRRANISDARLTVEEMTALHKLAVDLFPDDSTEFAAASEMIDHFTAMGLNQSEFFKK